MCCGRPRAIKGFSGPGLCPPFVLHGRKSKLNEGYREFYRPSGQQSFLEGEQGGLFKDASTGHVVDYIRERLQTIFPVVSNAGILRNGKGAPLFALVLGVSSRSSAAQKIALEIADHLVRGLGR
jgi:hypothetical protein